MEIWTYDNRINDNNSVIIIYDELVYNNEVITFIGIKNVIINEEIVDIDFMPFKSSVLKKCLKEKINDELVSLDFNLENTIEGWKKDNGGIWSIPVSEAIEITEKTIEG